MAKIHTQVWLTSALTNDQVSNVLTLACSLKRVSSSRKMCVIASPKLSLQMKNVLHKSFPSVFYLTEELNEKKLKDEDFVKIFTLTLTCFSKCVYLSPTMLVLKNCDELFERDDLRNSGGVSCFVVRPSFERFNHFLESIRDGKEIEKFLAAEGNSPIEFRNTKYDCQVLTISGILNWNASFVNLSDIRSERDPKNCEPFEKLILNYQKLIVDEDVEPLLISPDTIYKPLEQLGTEPVAIIGMSCRYPNASNAEEFWNLLISGKESITTPPDCRWTTNMFSSADAHYRQTKAGFLNYPVEEFDAKFFNISPKEMLFLDPQQRLLHELVWEGLENSGVNPQSLRGTRGSVFLGAWTNDYKELLNGARLNEHEYYRSYMGNSFGAAAARLSFLLGMTGPSIATESGCSSAMVAVHLACKSLHGKETNFALACGVNLLLHPFDKNLIPMVLSASGACKTWDANADGFVRAEGGGVLVLKRVSDAVRDGDNILGLIRGSAMSQEGTSKSMGTPTVLSESLAMSQALEDAGVLPEQVSFVETHGTGTPVGDPLEIEAIAKAYHSPNRKEPLLIGSVKTNVGHTESCSGITGIMKVILALEHEIIPPHRNFETLNPAIDLEAIPARIPLEPVKWPKQKGISRVAGVSSFGITGTDAHIIIEEAPAKSSRFVAHADDWERPWHVMKISAKTQQALDILVDEYKSYLADSKENFKDVAHTANVGRADFSYRAILTANSGAEAITQIESKNFRSGELNSGESCGKIGFLFTGQGSQYPEMAQRLYENSPVFRANFEYCANILKNRYNIDISQVLWFGKRGEEIRKTIYSQPSIFCVEIALLRLWESWGVSPDYVVGHSLGEFAAAVAAGILNLEDALQLVAERSRLIDNLPPGKMLVVKADFNKTGELMKQFAQNEPNNLLEFAALNSCEQTVLAGDCEVVLEFSEFCGKSGVKSILLQATHAFHSKHMDPILNQYKKVAASLEVPKAEGNFPVFISGVRGCVVKPTEVDSNYWVAHTRERVEFVEASRTAVELGCKTFVEIGPQPVLSALMMMNSINQPIVCLPSLKSNENEWETLLSSVSQLYIKGVEINWIGWDQPYKRRKVNLPHYPFARKSFWPEISATAAPPLHPLLGCLIPNPSTIKLFTTGLNLKNLDYLRDHAIGNNIIFPATAYLEMCLAAGLATVNGSTDTLTLPNLPMMIQNAVIKMPLSLQESETRQIQTVAELNVSINEIKVEIFQKRKNEGWLLHATATFLPFTSQSLNIPFDSKNSLIETLNNLPSSSEADILEMYENLGVAGLNFGPAFKSIEKVWRVGKNALVTKVKAPTNENQRGYLIHPILLDAMIQSVVLVEPSVYKSKKLYVPLKIGKLVWLSSVDPSKNIYIYAFSPPTESCCSALLIDGAGNHLAFMSSVDLIETTVRGLHSFLEQQSITLPEMWEEVWKAGESRARSPMEIQKAAGKLFTADFKRRMRIINEKPPAHILQTVGELEQFIYYNTIQVLYKLGWNPVENNVFKENDLIQTWRVKESLGLYVGFLLGLLEQEGILQKISDIDSSHVTWKVMKIPPSPETVREILKSSQFSGLPSKFRATLLMGQLGQKLPSILRGEQEPLGILFPPQNADYPSVGEFYTEYTELINASELTTLVATSWISHVKEKLGENNSTMRVLEVGAGTGFFSSHMLRVFKEQGLKFEYTYTDISTTFFPAAEKRFEEYGGNIIFKKLNIEEDPIGQGFTPEFYDAVLASEVVHATKNIKASLQNMKVLLKPRGTLGLLESMHLNRIFTFLFGSLEGFWKFEDKELRSRHCQLSNASWSRVLGETGFSHNGVFSLLNGSHSYFACEKIDHGPKTISKAWIVFTLDCHPISEFLVENLGHTRTLILVTASAGSFEEKEMEGNKILIKIGKESESDFKRMLESFQNRGLEIEGVVYCWALERSSTSQEAFLRPYVYLAKAVLSSGIGTFPRFYALTTGSAPLGETEMSQFHTATLWGFTRALKNENFGLTCKCIEVSDGNWDEVRCGEIFYELWNHEKDVIVAFHGKARYVPRLEQHKPINSALTLPPGSDRFQLILPESRSIKDIQFGPLAPSSELQENHIEIQVRVTALNFRDVFSVLKPSEKFKNMNTVGLDFAGVVLRVGDKVTKWKAGDEVCGFNSHMSPMPSHHVLHEDTVLTFPHEWTFAEAATIPAVYMTSILCLLDIAKIEKEDVVLIHTASGGVGLSAIEICKYIGCTVIATAGSRRKQNYLREVVGLKHIFHSRNTQFSSQILKLTNGRGVDVVLNSLTGEGFKEATLEACGKGARFVEMSKLNIWTKEEVKEMRPDVDYTVVVISADELQRLAQRVQQLQLEGVVKPIPYVKFEALDIRAALSYLQKAKHIGKVVCVMPQLRREGGELKLYTPMFNDKSSYLITGGLGGIGLVVCRWMLENGAKHVILASRSLPNSCLERSLNELNSEGANVSCVQLDVGNMEQCRELLEIKIPQLGLPKLRGIMHAAGTLADGLLQNLEWSDFTTTFKAKIDGSLNLHELTKQLQLEYFVMFSSISALFGPPGQCNYSAGNVFEDALTHYRNSLGLPATTINWGLWAEVGVAQETDVPGLSALSNFHGVAGLSYVLKGGRTQTAIFNTTSFHMVSKVYPQLAHYLDKQILSTNAPTLADPIVMSSEQFFREYDSTPELENKIHIMKTRLRNLVRETLKHDQKEIIEDDEDLQEMGVDSLMLVEIRNGLQALLGSRLAVNASSLKDCTSISLISKRLVSLLEGGGGETGETHKRPTMEQVNALIRKDCELPQNIKAKAGQKVADVGEIKNILLTGCSGTLGPYILKELTNLPQVRQVVCLMRPPKKGSMDGKLSKILEGKNLLSKVDLKKVTCVAGNVAEPNLGLEQRLWVDLCEQMDAVFHVAVSSQHTEIYTSQRRQNGSRAVNVDGTKNILEFATENRLKRVYHASSLLAVATVDESGRLSEDWPEIEDYDNVTSFAYPVSKFVGDFLMKQGVERGIPCKVFRFPLISGESQTGCCSIENNHLLLRYMFVMKNGIIPSSPFPMVMLPVDTCAEGSVKLFFDKIAPSGVFNILQRQPDTDQEFVGVAHQFGYTVNVVDYTEFAQRVRSFAGRGDDSPLSMFEEFYGDDNLAMELYNSIPALRKWIEGNQLHDQSSVWVSTKMDKYLPSFYESHERTVDYIYRDLCFLKSQGCFQKFGLE